MTEYERTKYCAVFHYVHCRINGYDMGASSISAARLFWLDQASEYYRPMIIKNWARQYLEKGEISFSKQGSHIKTFSLLSDEAIAMDILARLRSQDPQKRDLVMLKKYVDEEIVLGEIEQKLW